MKEKIGIKPSVKIHHFLPFRLNIAFPKGPKVAIFTTFPDGLISVPNRLVSSKQSVS